MRSNPQNVKPVEYRDEFHRQLWLHGTAAAFQGRRREAANIIHLAVAYGCGVDREEIMERIEAGEVTR